MCPFLDEEDDFDDYRDDKDDLILRPREDNRFKSRFLKDDKKFFIIGGSASIIAFCAVMYVMYSNNKPIDLEELPVIKADTTPIKVKPTNNLMVDHQDKIVYDNISGIKRSSSEEKTVLQTEEDLSINEIDSDGDLSDEEKKKIIQAFDDLAPDKDYKIKYVKSQQGDSKYVADAKKIRIIEQDNGSPPIKKIEEAEKPKLTAKDKKHKGKTKDLVASAVKEKKDTATTRGGGSVMIQVASVSTKSAAEAEYKRIVRKNKMLRGVGKKIVRVDLGKPKGIVYRVQVGPFKDKPEAQKMVSSLKNNGFYSYIPR